MFRKATFVKAAFTGLALAISICSNSYGQCDCGSCNDAPIGIDYTQLDSCGSCVTDSCGSGSDCGDCYGVTDRCCKPKCLYFSGFGGWNGLQNFEQNNIFDNTMDANGGLFDDGSLIGAAIGSQVHQRVRFELEASVRENDAEGWLIETFEDGLVTASATTPATAGTLRAKSGMANILFDIQQRQAGCWNGYIGGGIGIASVDGTIVAGDTYVVDDESVAFQGIAGLNRALSRKLDLFAEYRAFTAQQVVVNNVSAGIPLGNFNYTTNSVVVGLRIRR